LDAANVEITVSLERSITPDSRTLLRTIGQLPGGTMGGCRYQVNHRPLAVSLTIKIQGMSSQRCAFVDRTTNSFVRLWAHCSLQDRHHFVRHSRST
jgi:hypothetical protein